MVAKTYPISSSFMESCTYDDETGELVIFFTKGGSYPYQVDRSTFIQFINAPSQGRFFNANLR